MIRTNAVEIKAIKGMAFKQKLTAGGAGLTLVTPEERAVFTINKRDGAYVPYGKVNESVFTAKVLEEAFELTRNLPYRRLGAITKVYEDSHCDETPAELEAEDEKTVVDVIASAEYKAFIAQYTDKNANFSFQLMNKDLMQFAARSSVVGKMLAERAGEDLIVRYIVRSKAAHLARNKGMDEPMLIAFIDTFDSMNTRSAFKELKAYLRGKLSKSKK